MPSGLTFGFLEYGVRTLFKNLDSFHLYRIIYRFIRLGSSVYGNHMSLVVPLSSNKLRSAQAHPCSTLQYCSLGQIM
jgi:hypothetical protein